MRRSAASVLGVALVIGAFMAGAWYDQRHAAAAAASRVRRILYYVDPMHPAYKSDKPGTAPDCGMQLQPVYEASTRDDVAPAAGATPPDVVAMTAEKRQLLGVRVSAVARTKPEQTLRLFGRVTPSEGRVYSVNAGLDGFIRDVSAVTTGTYVQKDQWLATFSAPDIRQPTQAYLVTLGIQDRSAPPADEHPAQVKATTAASQLAIDKLMNLGMSAAQIEEVRRTREVPVDIRILAPGAGFVLARNVSPGQKFSRGTEWYRIADLRQVWIIADVFENDAAYLRPGTRVRVSFPGGERPLSARVAAVLPQFDLATRTFKVRLEADNPGYVLRPDMFVDVELPIGLPPAITLPVDAIVDTGLSRTVFVERSDGLFERRQVDIGRRIGDVVVIERGLTPGERVVVSGTFLLDSDSRMRALPHPSES